MSRLLDALTVGALLFCLAGCATPTSVAIKTVVPPTATMAATPTTSPRFSGERALAMAARQMTFGPRPTGSDALWALGDAILTELAAQGWQTQTQAFTPHGTRARNLIALKGTGSTLIVFGAHYDTRRRADQDPTKPRDPVPGANDGASGAAVLLELARTLDVPADKRVALVFFDAEDNGGLDGWEWIEGSRVFAMNAERFLGALPASVIVVDMIGDADQDIYQDRASDAALTAEIWAVAAKLGYQSAFIPATKYTMLDDHTPFVERGVRAVDIIDFDYPHWHRTSDTLDKLSAASLERVGRTLETWVEGR